MKQFFVAFLVLAFFANLASAAEVTTDCPWMRESTERNNPKANIQAAKPKPKQASSATAQ